MSSQSHSLRWQWHAKLAGVLDADDRLLLPEAPFGDELNLFAMRYRSVPRTFFSNALVRNRTAPSPIRLLQDVNPCLVETKGIDQVMHINQDSLNLIRQWLVTTIGRLPAELVEEF
mmetsp:Transcript_821/g.1764  ORF Transcript_821/g.1764 Transcript_821/m.1764 type:complete len:116 (+) Transcript_821:1023-1370(+)